jgi:hypothetical protein
MSLTRAKRDIDWGVGTSISDPVSISRAWELGTTFNNPVSADPLKLGLIVVFNEDGAGTSNVVAVTVGSETATEITSQFVENGFSNDLAIFQLTNAQLANLGASEAINVDFTNAPDSFSVSSGIYQSVSQTSPVVGTGSSALDAGETAVSVNATAEDDGVSIFTLGSGSGGTLSGVTVGYVEQTNVLDGNGNRFVVYEKLPSDSPSETVNATLSTNNRFTALIINLRKA